MLDENLPANSRERALATGIDWRNGWVSHEPERGLVAWPAAAARVLDATPLEVLAVLESASVVEPMRERPAHTAAMVSEVRAGERLRGLCRRDGWWLVAGEDDYTGWVHEWVLREPGADPGPPAFRYGRPVGTLWLSDHHAAVPLVLGAPLWEVAGPLRERGDQHLLRAPGGKEGWLPARDLRSPATAPGSREALNLVRGLMGTPYRWGGRSPFGFDCSGLVQFVTQLCGVDLPRDAAQQAVTGDAVPLDEEAWAPADLVFFGEPADHVGFLDGRGHLLHCQGFVRQERISARGDLFERTSAVRRWLPLQGAGSGRAWTASVQ